MQRRSFLRNASLSFGALTLLNKNAETNRSLYKYETEIALSQCTREKKRI